MNLTTRSLVTIEQMAMFVVKSIHIQIHGQVMDPPSQVTQINCCNHDKDLNIDHWFAISYENHLEILADRTNNNT